MAEQIIAGGKRATRTVIALPGRKKVAPRRKVNPDRPKIEPPIKPTPSQSIQIAKDIVDNTRSTNKRASTQYKTRYSRFLITFVPNTSLREEANPELYEKLKKELVNFAKFILDPANIDDILTGVDDPNWKSKIIGLMDDKVASIEDSKNSNKRLHTHIYYPVEHKTKVKINLDNLREIAKIYLEPFGELTSNPHIDVKVERNDHMSGARDYVTKLGDVGDSVLIK